MLIHTDEHGANGIGPGTYTIRRKRETVIVLDKKSGYGSPLVTDWRTCSL